MTRNDRRAVALWLFICAALVLVIVVVGGITRLTRWQPQPAHAAAA